MLIYLLYNIIEEGLNMSEAEMLIIKEGTPTSDNVEAGANIFMQNIKPALGGVDSLDASPADKALFIEEPLEEIEFYVESNFIGEKPDSKIDSQLEGSNNEIQIANFSPLNQSLFSNSQFQLLSLNSASSYMSEIIESDLQRIGLTFADSYLSGLKNGTSLISTGFYITGLNASIINFSLPNIVTPKLYDGPTLSFNSALLTVEDTLGATISNTLLLTTDIDTIESNIIYTVTVSPRYGQLELTTGPSVPITSFTQDDIDNNLVIYVHNGDETPSGDGFTFNVTDGDTSLTGQTFDITVKDFSETLDFATFQSPTPATAVSFGFSGGYYSPSVFGPESIIINDPEINVGGVSQAGSLYAFDINTGDLLYTIDNPTPGVGDFFGSSTEISGNNLLVKVGNDDTGATDAGSIYIYDLTTGGLLYTINNPTPGVSDFFGSSTDIFGNNLIVKTSNDDTGTTDAGSIYIYDITTGGLLHTINNPTPSVGDFFGSSTDISGNNLIVKTSNDDTGATDAGSIYIYDITTGGLLHTINNPTPGVGDFFGSSTDISGNNLIVKTSNDDTGATNAGSIYIYDLTTGGLLHTINNPTPGVSDFFGQSTEISGNNLIVKTSNDDTGATNAGSIYIYDLTTGGLLHTINNPTPGVSDFFGQSTEISGNNLIVKVRNDDTGATNAGSIYIYDLTTGGLLHTINNPTPGVSDFFGQSTEISGNNLIVKTFNDDTGATNAGSIYIYDLTTGGLLHTINNPTPAVGNYFGQSTEISGNNLIVKVRNDDTGATNAGSIYIYDLTTGGLLHTINNPTPAVGDSFGSSTKILGNTLFVGVSGEDIGATNAGSVYVFDIPTGELLHTINNPNPTNNSGFSNETIEVMGQNLIVSDNPTTGLILYNYKMDLDENGVLTGSEGSDTMYGLNGDDILYGGGGADILFGGNGSDTFVFEEGALFATEDRIEDFSIGENDILDISNILSGFNPGISNIADFARFIDSGADAYLEIDTNGTFGGVNFESVALVVGGAGLDAVTLEGSGNLDAVI